MNTPLSRCHAWPGATQYSAACRTHRHEIHLVGRREVGRQAGREGAGKERGRKEGGNKRRDDAGQAESVSGGREG